MKGFLGTNAGLWADLSLVLSIAILLTLFVGAFLAVRRRYTAHQRCQTAAVVLNIALVAVVMLGSYSRSVASGVPQQLSDPFYGVATAHAALGTLTVLMGLFMVLRGNNLVPRALAFNNYKPWMRATLALYTLTTAFGIWTYTTWYTGGVAAAPLPNPVPAPVVDATPQPGATIGAAQPQKLTVPVANFSYNPVDLTIPVGTTLMWVNQDGAPHTVTADGGQFVSGTFGKGQQFSFTFTTPGSFPYFCELHGAKGGVDMAGKITVVAVGVAVAPTAVQVPTQVPPSPQPTPPPLPTAVATGPEGLASFRNERGHNDQLALMVQQLPPPPADIAYVAFLTDATGGNPLNIGTISSASDGSASLLYSAPDRANLLARYTRLVITSEAAETPVTTPSGAPVLVGALPPEASKQLQLLLVNGIGTPDRTAYLAGLLAQAGTLQFHTDELESARKAGDFQSVTRHAEHVFNIIVGVLGTGFGDPNGDGKSQNPGDGFGLLPNGDVEGYLTVVTNGVQAAAAAPDASDALRAQSAHVLASLENIRTWASEARDLARTVAQAKDLAATEAPAKQLLALAEQLVAGRDIDGDGTIDLSRGEGGALAAYQGGQFMAAIALAPSDEQALSEGQVQPTPTPAAVAVEMRDYEFVMPSLTVRVGTTVTWKNAGKARHSAKADDGSFDTTLFDPGQEKSVTFSKPGTFAYFCELHGAKGGQGMAGVVVVQP